MQSRFIIGCQPARCMSVSLNVRCYFYTCEYRRCTSLHLLVSKSIRLTHLAEKGCTYADLRCKTLPAQTRNCVWKKKKMTFLVVDSHQKWAKLQDQNVILSFPSQGLQRVSFFFYYYQINCLFLGCISLNLRTAFWF